MLNPLNEKAKFFLEKYQELSPYAKLGVVVDKPQSSIMFISWVGDSWLVGNVGSFEYREGYGFEDLEAGTVYGISELISFDKIEGEKFNKVEWSKLG